MQRASARTEEKGLKLGAQRRQEVDSTGSVVTIVMSQFPGSAMNTKWHQRYRKKYLNQGKMEYPWEALLLNIAMNKVFWVKYLSGILKLFAE